MATVDLRNGIEPVLVNKPVTEPTIDVLVAAIEASDVADNYAGLLAGAYTRNDLIYVCRTEGIDMVEPEEEE